MQIKIFRHTNYTSLEEKINAFIEDKNIVDIKFQANEYGYYAMIMYVPYKNLTGETTVELL